MPSTVLITGCSSGFGLATAQRFLAAGWNVVATMRSPQQASFDSSDRLLLAPLDVTSPASIAAAIERGIERFGKIDVMVNNAGIGLFGAAEATPDEAVRQVFETNTFGTISMARAVIPHMRAQGSGTIVNVTSSVGIAPMPLVAAYTASKYAIEGFSESLAYEVGLFGIRVKIVQPGLAPTTSFASNSGDGMSERLPAAYAEFAGRYFESMQNYPTAYTTADDVATTVYTAATSSDARLRYPAGADSVMLAELRQSLPQQALMAHVRAMTGA